MLRASFLLQKMKKESYSVNTGDRVMVFVFCNFLYGPLSVYQLSFTYLQNFKRYVPDKLTIAKIRSFFVNTGDKVMVLFILHFSL